jgi:hypothetical protein
MEGAPLTMGKSPQVWEKPRKFGNGWILGVLLSYVLVYIYFELCRDGEGARGSAVG